MASLITKQNRTYKLFVETNDKKTIEINPPFTIEFDITRGYLSSANTSTIKIYNLSSIHRNQILKPPFAYYDIRQVLFLAGYKTTQMSTVFNGFITEALYERQGTDMITTISAFDGGSAYIKGTVNRTYQKGTPLKSVIIDLIGTLPGVALGAVGNYTGTLTKSLSVSGNTAEIINQLTGNGLFVDNGKAYVMTDSEVLNGTLQTIDSTTGLLGTPIVESQLVRVNMLFEPRLFVGQQLTLNSSTAINYRGTPINTNYKVYSIQHRGMISDSVCGTATTTVGLNSPKSIVVVGNAG